MATKKKVTKKTPANPLDKKILKAVTNGANRLEKIVMAVKHDGSVVTTRLNYLKRHGKVAFISAQGWHIPAEGYVAPKASVAPSPIAE